MIKPGHLLFATLLSAGLLAGCGTTEPPHSDYFTVTFAGDGSGLAPEGRLAVENLRGDLGRHNPRLVTITAYSTTAPPSAGFEQAIAQRTGLVAQEVEKAGVPATAIQTRTRMLTPEEFLQLRDSVAVQLTFGEPAK